MQRMNPMKHNSEPKGSRSQRLSAHKTDQEHYKNQSNGTHISNIWEISPLFA